MTTTLISKIPVVIFRNGTGGYAQSFETLTNAYALPGVEIVTIAAILSVSCSIAMLYASVRVLNKVLIKDGQ
jgi:hypothetical protein